MTPVKHVSASDDELTHDALSSAYDHIVDVDKRLTELHADVAELRQSLERKLHLLAKRADPAARALAEQRRARLTEGEEGLTAGEFVEMVRKSLE